MNISVTMDKKTAESSVPGGRYGQVRRGYRDRTPDTSAAPTFEELRNRFDTSASREIAANPATHGSAMRQVVSGKVFKKCKSATFQIDGATYTIGKLTLGTFAL